ncbi:right-handed parallel beta-helix repeat-containing protein, partial [Bacillus velezensis]|uniref:right-handed parallel beta-helix repeat-containing protein n=1 Tax=Bacillus velezensis TaxID=492670 RepID=UPI002FFF74F8
YIGESSAFRFGDINSSGEIVPSTSKIILSNSDMNLSSVHFQRTKELLLYPSSIDSLTNKSYAIYFYDQNNRFISSQKNVQFLQDSVKIPTGAYYYKLAFDAKKIAPDLRVDVWAFYFAENVLVDNCNIHDNRRQGISVVGGRNITISNCILHDIKGTAPQSGIDVEGGDYPNDTITIENNQFYNNNSFDLIFYDGEYLKASNNVFGSKGKVGLSTSSLSKNKTITNNVFNGTSAYVYGAAFSGNTIYSSKIFGYKSSTIENNTFQNARLELYDASILVNGCTFINTDQSAGWNIYTPGIDFTISNSKFTGDPGASIAGGDAKNITYINSQFKDIGRTIYASKITNSTFTSTSAQSYMEVSLKENSTISGSTFNNVRVYIENSATSSATQKTIE